MQGCKAACWSRDYTDRKLLSDCFPYVKFSMELMTFSFFYSFILCSLKSMHKEWVCFWFKQLLQTVLKCNHCVLKFCQSKLIMQILWITPPTTVQSNRILWKLEKIYIITLFKIDQVNLVNGKFKEK